LEKQEIVPESSLKYVPVVVGTPHQKKIVSLQRENSHFQQ
jgi:hypothetical protein